MSNVFDKAVQIARERQEWEAEVNPGNEPFALAGLGDKELARSQKMIVAFQKSIGEAAKASKFKSADEVAKVVAELTFEERRALTVMAELCIPVEPSTMAIAQAIAPARVGTVARIRAGNFGIPETPEEAAKREAKQGGQVHRAVAPEAQKAVTKGDVAATTAEQSEAFDRLSSAMGVSMKEASSKQSLARLGGVRMVEGELVRVPAVAEPLPKGQMRLFSEELAPTPEGGGDKKRAPRSRKGA